MTKKDNEPMILEGDCIEVMKEFDENTFDAIVTDPPYGLEFMGKEWDKLGIPKQGARIRPHEDYRKFGGYKDVPNAYVAGTPMQLWHTQWLTEAYRVLKPGGSMLVMGGTRTFHRLMVAIEDSGFIIKDTLMWIYGSGFPKAQDLGKMIDKRMGVERKIDGQYVAPDGKPRGVDKGIQGNSYAKGEGNYQKEKLLTLPSTDLAKHWDGFKIGGIKPAYEPIVWAVKPPEGSYIDNVLKWGVGAVNVDECRVGCSGDKLGGGSQKRNTFVGKDGWDRPWRHDEKAVKRACNRCNEQVKIAESKGRFPANVILSHHPECEQVGMKRVKNEGYRSNEAQQTGAIFGSCEKTRVGPRGHADSKGLEKVESWDCHPDCAIRVMDEQSGVSKSNTGSSTGAGYQDVFVGGKAKGGIELPKYTDSGGASRFFYCAKASRGERNMGLEGMEEKERAGINKMMGNEKGGNSMRTGSGNIRNNKLTNNHPTVKPIKLFEYLIKLVTRKNQIILDPFLGSGTTMVAANNVDRECVGIEREEEYIPIAEKRVEYWLKEKEKND